MTHPRPAGPAVPSLSEASVVWPPSFLLCLSAPRWLGNAHNPLAGSPAIPRGIHVSLHQNQLWGCPSLLWNSPSSLEVGTLARAVSSGLAPVSVSSRTPGGGLASSLSSSPDLVSAPASESCGGQPLSVAFIPAQGPLAHPPPSQHFPAWVPCCLRENAGPWTGVQQTPFPS